MKPKIICTIGPGSLNEEVLYKLKDRGADFFRINLSHTEEKNLEGIVQILSKIGVPIIIDTEGSQVRTANEKEILLREGDLIRLHNKKVICDEKNLLLNPEGIIANLREGDLIFIDFNSVLLKVVSVASLKKENHISCKVLIGGTIGGKKAVYIDSPTFRLPPFSEKDLNSLKIAKKYGIKTFTLSFMESAESVRFFKKNCPGAKIFSKIESKEGLKNFIEIAKESDGLLIDRGDLSHQVPLEKIPLLQKYIISKCRELKKEVFVATNTLEQMSFTLKPNRAETNDIINTLLDGATGIALTKEMAVGKYPVETLNMLVTLIKQLEFVGEGNLIKQIEKTDYLSPSEKIPGLLIEPHGGKLVDCVYKKEYLEKDLPKKRVKINEENLMDIEQIAIGAFSPIEGFMNKKEFYSVLETMHLSTGILWPLPIFLSVDKKDAENLSVGDEVSLEYSGDGKVYALLKIEDIFRINKKEVAEKLFETSEPAHPGVKNLLDGGEVCIGGKISLIRRRNSEYNLYELTPGQVRKIFSERGWSKVIGFHTRNIPHKGHEFIQTEGLLKSTCDGLFIHPIIGKKKKGDFEAKVIIETYEHLIEKAYKSKALLSAFASYSRYAGPREALFTALVRKNFGCSHFIVGRDHTGVGNFYEPEAAHKIFDKFSKELGIIPVKFNKVFYSEIEGKYLHEEKDKAHPEEKKKNISGTEARKMLQEGKCPPDWFMRKEISEIIIKNIKDGEKVFVE